MNVNVTSHSRCNASAYALAAQYRFQRMDRTRAWSQFVIDRSLQPEMDARDFYAIFDAVYPCPLASVQSVEFEATHWDTLRECEVQITQDDAGVYRLLWADGSTGSSPPALEPSARYRALEDAK